VHGPVDVTVPALDHLGGREGQVILAGNAQQIPAR
jgi:hypothetical protein